MLRHFGEYEAAFTKGELSVPGHLVLLHLDGSDRNVVLDRIDHANKNGGNQEHIDGMLSQADWRPHLVAAWALLLDVAGTYKSTMIWCAIDMGSWVCPQLIAAATLVTDDFDAQVASRLKPNYSTKPPIGLTPMERHSATGPAGTPSRYAKLINVLQEAVGFEVACEIAGKEVVEKAIADDVDNGSEIYKYWRLSMLESLRERGIERSEM